MNVSELLEIYEGVKETIEKRLEEFEKLWKEGTDYDIFKELVFCLLTPQSKARVCWRAVESMDESGAILNGSEKDLLKHLKGVRFKENKARYIVMARELFSNGGALRIKSRISSFNSPFESREWLVNNVKGMGYKEASHFLRNIGFGKDLAILDRHILKNLKIYGVIEDIPKSLTRRRYMLIEERMRQFSKRISIPMAHLDLLLWYKEAGEVFK